MFISTILCKRQQRELSTIQKKKKRVSIEKEKNQIFVLNWKFWLSVINKRSKGESTFIPFSCFSWGLLKMKKNKKWEMKMEYKQEKLFLKSKIQWNVLSLYNMPHITNDVGRLLNIIFDEVFNSTEKFLWWKKVAQFCDSFCYKNVSIIFTAYILFDGLSSVWKWK